MPDIIQSLKVRTKKNIDRTSIFSTQKKRSACGEEQSTCNGVCFWAPARQFSIAQCLGGLVSPMTDPWDDPICTYIWSLKNQPNVGKYTIVPWMVWERRLFLESIIFKGRTVSFRECVTKGRLITATQLEGIYRFNWSSKWGGNKCWGSTLQYQRIDG